MKIKKDQWFKTTIKEVPNKSGTKHVYIPKLIIDILKLDKGDEIIVSVRRSEEVELWCRCLSSGCGHESMSVDTNIFCKKCGKEDMEIISDDVEEVLNKKQDNTDDII